MTLKQFRQLFYFIDKMYEPKAPVRIVTKWFDTTSCVTLFNTQLNCRHTLKWLDKQRWELQ